MMVAPLTTYLIPLGDLPLIRVSPFSGNSEICPRDKSRVLSEMHWRNMHAFVNKENIRRAANILYQPRKRLRGEIYADGYRDALQYINNNQLNKRIVGFTLYRRLFTVPYFSVGFSRLVRFDRTPTIFVCNGEHRWLLMLSMG